MRPPSGQGVAPCCVPREAPPGTPACSALPPEVADLEPGVVSAAQARRAVRERCRHYENFSLASLFLPPRLRPPLRSIYAFARFSDDLADEDGGLSRLAEGLGLSLPELRRRRLRHWDALLEGLPGTASRHPILFCLWLDAQAHHLPLDECHKLLQAFLQDQDAPAFPHDQAVLDYCRHSAAPVGRLLLALNGITEGHGRWGELVKSADDLCAGLQLVNFWQDLSRDLPAGRLYIPMQRIEKHGLPADAVGIQMAGDAAAPLIHALLDWAESLLLSGEVLARRLPPRFALEVRLYAGGGLAVLAKCRELGPRLLEERPSLAVWEKLRIGLHALVFHRTNP